MKQCHSNKYWVGLVCLCLLSACFKADPTSSVSAESSDTPHSAIEVKREENTLNLSSLSPPAQNNIQDYNQPILPNVATVFAEKANNVQVEDTGKIVKLLPDDTNGLRHQKFLVKITSGQTLLFAHNIDLAQRIENIAVGDTIEFRGEYVYNPKGGIVHWTHHDPSGHHHAGWIKLNGHVYQ